MNGALTIGLHMTADEQTRRYAEGVLDYVGEHEDLKIADFCYPGDDPDLSESPPWSGKADGVVVSVRRRPGIMPWLRRGGVPVVGVGADLKRDVATAFSNPRTVGEELRQVRLERAKDLLKTTDLPVASVARMLSMNAGSYLNDFFRRWTGTTPLKYRRQCRENPV
jgi:hypothetical protein